MASYAANKSVDQKSIKFIYDGARIREEQTPESVGGLPSGQHSLPDRMLMIPGQWSPFNTTKLTAAWSKMLRSKIMKALN